MRSYGTVVAAALVVVALLLQVAVFPHVAAPPSRPRSGSSPA
jgi:hypothetical protein